METLTEEGQPPASALHDDWMAYSSTTQSTLDVFGRDEIILGPVEGASYLTARRIEE